MRKEGANHLAIGVVSWGVEGCQAGAPSVAHRVTTSLPWILLTIADSLLCPANSSTASSSPSTCVTVAGARVGWPCVFPFTVAGIEVAGCTRVDGDEVRVVAALQRSWCSVQVDGEGRHMEGYWGYCSPTGCTMH